MPLHLEALAAGMGWKPLGVVAEGDPPGSLADNPPGGGRDVILFGYENGRCVIWRSVAGADYETGGGAVRAVATTGLEDLAVLRPGEFYTMAVRTDRGTAATVRWTHKP
jgi:hypothetical protein